MQKRRLEKIGGNVSLVTYSAMLCQDGGQCCWTCVPCRDEEFLFNETACKVKSDKENLVNKDKLRE